MFAELRLRALPAYALEAVSDHRAPVEKVWKVHAAVACASLPLSMAPLVAGFPGHSASDPREHRHSSSQNAAQILPIITPRPVTAKP